MTTLWTIDLNFIVYCIIYFVIIVLTFLSFLRCFFKWTPYSIEQQPFGNLIISAYEWLQMRHLPQDPEFNEFFLFSFGVYSILNLWPLFLNIYHLFSHTVCCCAQKQWECAWVCVYVWECACVCVWECGCVCVWECGCVWEYVCVMII